ncbi:pH regulation protein F [Alkalibaculum sp. M08DMB]|uniref:pH regulation protein F n=1 Tax=Alkalibaculum sporogenes TaxID=2655001 RepID=A0A6A7K973_9FIRM|nr:monovalent cation/H+ antiporter complex subunit F [Alkalibaculum sporogenes]MPW25747.1 pH regulation protein F [Alkalibaculum sporogenes]
MSFYQIVLLVIAFFTAMVIIRVIMGPTIWDRLLGLNMVSAKIIMSIVILAIIQDSSFLLDIALVYAFLGFVGTVFIARFIERRGNL